MKCVIVVCVFALAAVVYARPEEKYTDKYDKIDLDEILTNTKLFGAYVKCLLDEGKCTADAKELKSKIPDALENDCAKCTDAQKDGTRKVMSHLINKSPEHWQELKAKYDPDNKYSKKHEKELKEIQE